jgi:hypothetical protein
VTAIDARGHRQGWVGLLMEHEGGKVSDVSICGRTTGESRTEVEVFGETERLSLDARAVRGDAFGILRQEFAETARAGGGHPVDAARGLYLQRLIIEAESRLPD